MGSRLLPLTAAFLLPTSCSSGSSDSEKSSQTASINPPSVTLKTGGEVTFTSSEETSTESASESTATADSSATLFDWKITEGASGGTLTQSPTLQTYKYKAPAAAGVFHVVITSKKYPTATATSTITVTP